MFQLVLLFGLGLSFSATAYNYNTPVNLDGKDIQVYFNDGDTFQMTIPLRKLRVAENQCSF